MLPAIKMVVGLGNPGDRYEATRHNAGFMVLDLLADDLETYFKLNKRHRSLWSQVRAGTKKALLVKPLTYMNNSGWAVASLVRWYGLAAQEIMIVYDDINLPPGRLRIRPSGSAGGHRGMQSIIKALGTNFIPRIKIGIGRPPLGENIVDFVLRPFCEKEWAQVSPMLIKAAGAAGYLLAGGHIEEAMNNYNC